MTALPVTLIGPADDAHVIGVAERVRALGAEAFILDPRRFPSSMKLTLGEQSRDVVIDGRPLHPASVYVRNVSTGPVQTSSDATQDAYRAWLLHRERADVITALVSRWEQAGIPIYNGLASGHRITKPFQLALLAEAGLPVPVTRWTNDPDAVRSLADGRRIAYKPVSGGAATRELTADDLTDARLTQLGTAPVAFQELLPGEDIRVYVLDGEVISSIRIVSRELDFRGNEERCERIELPLHVQRQCVKAAEVIGLRFTGMDLKRDAAGTPRFLELNCSPMFLGFDKLAGTDIADRLVARLVAACGETDHRQKVARKSVSLG